MDKEVIETLKNKILTKIDRNVKLSHLCNKKIDNEYIEKLTDEWIALMEKDLEDL